MILDLVLGKTCESSKWVIDLKEFGAENIVVLDYDFEGTYAVIEGITYMSVEYLSKYIRQFDSVNYYKSLYGLPGMNGSMSSLFTKR